MRVRTASELLLVAFTIFAASIGQSQAGPAGPTTHIVHGGGVPGDEPVMVTGGPGFQFVSSAPISTRVVKGSPYSLEAKIDTTQTLADGNRISHHSIVHMYRDSEGRTRREETFANIGPWAAAGAPPTLVTIQDPLAGVDYVLDSEHKIATRLPSPPMPNFQAFKSEHGSHSTNQAEKNPPASMTNQIGVAGSSGSKSADVASAGVFSAMVPGPGLVGGYAVNEGYIANESYSVKSGPSIVSSSIGEQGVPNGKSQSLGKETIAGASAEGTRTSVEIPVGVVGNERPLELVNEKWFSPELQIVLRTKQSDPRLGDTEYNVTRLERAEPPHSLFEVPSDYQLIEGGMLEGEPK
jgi:hypothetical protein